MTAVPLPDFERPPINEVACGIVFQNLERLKAPHTGAFWQRLGDRFPLCEHADLIGRPSIVMGPPPLPRVWFVNAGGDELVQLQTDRLLYNWRRVGDTAAYPRYSKIIESFRNTLQLFLSFLRDYDLGPMEIVDCELTYFNQIHEGEGWQAISGITNVLPDICWRKDSRFLPNPKSVAWNIQFDLPNNKGTLDVKLRHGTRRTDQKSVLALDLTARGLSAERTLDSIWDWFDVAHEWIVRGFVDLTAAEIQKNVWQRRQ